MFCTTCHRELSEDHFFKNNRTGGYYGTCKECRKHYVKRYCKPKYTYFEPCRIPVIKELVKKRSLDKATLTGIIDRLERDGFIIRSHNPQDKREIIISRTGKDEIFKTKIPAASDEQNALFYKDFSQEEIFTFEKMLKKILKNCKDAEEKLI